jgi:hypothetical protein
VVQITKGGTPIDKAATFNVSLTDFLMTRSPISSLASGGNPVVVPNANLFLLFGQYLKSLPQPVSPPELNRITCTNCGN